MTTATLASLHELFAGLSREPLIVQKFLPAVARGRQSAIILVDGEAGGAGAINRVPAAGETRSNLHVGGRAEPAKASPNATARIVAAIGPLLREKGQVFVGIDVIGGFLTRDQTSPSPTGIQELERFDGSDVAGRIWDRVEARLAD